MTRDSRKEVEALASLSSTDASVDSIMKGIIGSTSRHVVVLLMMGLAAVPRAVASRPEPQAPSSGLQTGRSCRPQQVEYLDVVLCLFRWM